MRFRVFQIKNLLLPIILILGFTFSTCSSSGDVIDNEVKDARIKLVSAKSRIAPFEDLKVSIDVDLEVLYASYDSIVWHANGVAYSSILFGDPWEGVDNERDIRFSDYRIGKHKVYALGYLCDKVVSQDSVEYEVIKPAGDFMSFRWSTETKDQYLHYTTGMTPLHYMPSDDGCLKIGGVSLHLYLTVENKDKKYAILQFVPWTFETNLRGSKIKVAPDINNFDWHDESDAGNEARYNMEYTFLHNYMTEFYGEPLLVYSGDDVTKTSLKEEYAKRFTYNTHYYPVEIWETPATVICLARANNSMGGVNQKGLSLVVAQPRKY